MLMGYEDDRLGSSYISLKGAYQREALTASTRKGLMAWYLCIMSVICTEI